MGKFTKSLTVVSLLIPVSGYSLGIGDIRVRSSLNQNLNAEINLVLTHGEDPNNIQVNLAPPEKFDEAGVSWSYFLSKIRFQPIVKSNGSVVIKVTSREALKEPYLNFLLEVSWPKGNLYREFTVLVDPPEEYQSATTYQEPAYLNTDRQQNYAANEEPIYRPRRRANRPKPIRRMESADAYDSQPVVRSRRAPVPSVGYGDQIVTRPNDSLSKVASRVRGKGVTSEQMMAAIYEKNPQAFYKQNMNALLANKRLKIPEQSDVQSITKQEALDEFNRHNLAWNTNHGDVGSGGLISNKEELADNQLKLEAPTDSAVTDTETVSPSTEQSTGSKSTSTKQQDKNASKGGIAKDGNGAESAVDDALQSKVAALEKQMAMMQELIALKDKQLAELQKSGATPATEEPNLPEVTAEAPKEIAEPAFEQPVQAVENKPEVPPATNQELPERPVATPVQPVEPPKAVVQPTITPAVQVPPVSEETIPLVAWILGGLSALLIPLFGVLWWQRKKISQETENNSIFMPSSTLAARASSKAPVRKQAPPESETLAGESSFLHDFKVSDFESFEAFNVEHGDIDPIAEADVYLAYGRYQQAEDLMRQAIKDTPDRDECKLKLLEIFQVSDNKDDFEEYAKELVAQGKAKDTNFWRKVAELSKAVSPDFALISAPAPSNVAVFDTESEDLSENVLFGVPSAEPQQEPVTVVQEKNERIGAATFEITENDGEESIFDVSAAHSELTKEQDSPKEASIKLGLNSKLESEAKPDSEPKESLAAFFEDDVKADTSDNRTLEFNVDGDYQEETLAFQSIDQLDFDLGPYPGTAEERTKENDRMVSFEQVEMPSPVKSKASDTAAKSTIESYEFDFGLDDDTSKLEAKSALVTNTSQQSQASAPKANWGGENLIEFDFDAPDEQEKAQDKELEFSFDIDPDFVNSPKPTYKDHDFAVSDLTDMDEMETKLDLAKAYIDMGDIESAKDIIAQVIEKGSAEQRVTAQSLLDDLYLG